jgi:hypothetical protein
MPDKYRQVKRCKIGNGNKIFPNMSTGGNKKGADEDAN